MMLRIFGCVAGAALCFLTGCESGRELHLVPVEGTVALDGKPLANKSLMFTPESGKGLSASANTDASGKYELLAMVTGTTSDEKGVPPGRYKVTVFEPAIPIEGAEGDAAVEGFLMPGAEGEAEGGIPLIYQDQTQTPLTVDVPEGGGTIDLELDSQQG